MSAAVCPGPGPDGGPCERPLHARGMCCAHYLQQRAGVTLRPVKAKRRNGEAPPPCAAEGCERPARAHGLCQSHLNHHYRGDELRPLRPYSRITPDGKTCPHCGQFKPLDAFVHQKGRPLASWCMACLPFDAVRKALRRQMFAGHDPFGTRDDDGADWRDR